VKPYQHPHYQERFQGRQEGGYQYYQGRRWNNFQYSWNKASQNHYSTRYYHRPTSTTNWRSFDNNTWNQGKENYATTGYHRLQLKRINFGWTDHHQWKLERRNIRKSYYLVSSHVKDLLANL
jgi:oligoribonuclease NrnB/cAMP/cGMP phosphodiesterase (DHH superfamily)